MHFHKLQQFHGASHNLINFGKHRILTGMESTVI